MSLYVSLFVLNDNTKVDGDILVQSRESSCQVMKIIQLANYTSVSGLGMNSAMCGVGLVLVSLHRVIFHVDSGSVGYGLGLGSWS